MNKGFNIPTYLGECSPEKIMELNLRAAQDKAYTLSREQKIIKRWKKLNSSIRKTGEYINQHFTQEISLELMSEEIGVSISVIKSNIDDLNFWHEFGYRMKRVKGWKNWISSMRLTWEI